MYQSNGTSSPVRRKNGEFARKDETYVGLVAEIVASADELPEGARFILGDIDRKLRNGISLSSGDIRRIEGLYAQVCR